MHCVSGHKGLHGRSLGQMVCKRAVFKVKPIFIIPTYKTSPEFRSFKPHASHNQIQCFPLSVFSFLSPWKYDTTKFTVIDKILYSAHGTRYVCVFINAHERGTGVGQNNVACSCFFI